MICDRCHNAIDEASFTCCCRDGLTTRPAPCPRCGNRYPPGSHYCDQCGLALVSDQAPRQPSLRSERKHVAVLFADISGYPEIIKRADPEDIREATRPIFQAMVNIIMRYGGTIDRVLWDGVMAVFGMPNTHEDDALRALHAALDIQRMAAKMEGGVEKTIGRPLAIRSGVACGLVVTGAAETDNGHHGITGDAVNLAARLRDLAAPGEILAESGIFSVAAGFFRFEACHPATIKGREAPVAVFRVHAAMPQPQKVRRVHGVKARLIARDGQLRRMHDAALRLRRGEGTLLTVGGDVGTGKSRLIAEFKASAGVADIRWLDGHAYAYNAGISYYPFIDMLNRLFDITESDAEAVVRQKINDGMARLMADGDTAASYLAGLYSSSLAARLAAGPEIFKSRLQQAFMALLTALAGEGPTIICLEDLHWADPSSLALLRFLLRRSALPFLFVVSYRPALAFMAGTDDDGLSYACEHIQLTDLDISASRAMVCALLKTPIIPEALDRYLVHRVEGNPLFLEEIVNALIDAKRLVFGGKHWHLDDTFDILDFSSTINGIIHDRLDRLGAMAKTILQEASVIGRDFRLPLLACISTFPAAVARCLDQMTRLDLIRRVDETGEPAYRFKHTLVQEVVYQGLLKNQRRAIHGKIARSMETLFHDRLDSVVETLARHYADANCAVKAVKFLTRSGEKSLRRYAVEEAFRYYERAYGLLSGISAPTPDEQAQLIDLLVKWYFNFSKQGLFREMLDLLKAHEEMVRRFGDPLRAGFYDVCLGWALQRRGRPTDALEYLHRALTRGESLANDRLIAYSSACLCWTCTDLGQMDVALTHGRRAAAVAERIGSDHELARFNLTGLGRCYFFAGDVPACWQTGERLLTFGETAGDSRTFSKGYLLMGAARMNAGDFAQAETLLEKAIAVAVDPIYAIDAQFFRSYCYTAQGKVEAAASTLETLIAANPSGGDYVGSSATLFHGIASSAKGHLAKTVAIFRRQIRIQREHGKRNHELILTHMLGRFFLSLVRRQGRASIETTFGNLWFLLRTLPWAVRLAERYLLRAIALGARVHARQRWGLACLDLGRLYTHQKRYAAARLHLARSADLFRRCGADVFLAEAEAALAELPR